MPELPEVELWARRLDGALDGVEVTGARAMGVVALKSFDPPLDVLAGSRITGVGRAGKMLTVSFEAAAGDASELTLLIHLMSAGRLNVHERPATLRDRTARIAIGLEGGRELRLREFGKRQRAWGKLVRTEALDEEEEVATLGPEAWPAPPLEQFAMLIDQPRHLHPMLRHQRTIAGIGRSWVDEVLWQARLSPFKQGERLDAEEVGRLHEALALLGAAIEHYEAEVPAGEIPDKLPMPLRVHKREGEPCPRCGAELAAVHFAEHTTTYCPAEQTGGKVLADRRLSRLLK